MARLNRNRIKKAFPFLADLVHWMKRRKNEIPAIHRHLARRKLQRARIKQAPGPIKVVFICQYIPAWSKNKALYDTLSKDGRFEAILLCVPNRIHANHLDDPEDMSNDTYEYFFKHGYIDAVNALVGKNQWFDLKTYAPDYVIYNRYDRPMPVPYTSTSVSAFAKVCLIIYGVSLLKVEEAMIDMRFSSNTFCFFAESRGIQEEFLSRNRILCNLKLSRAELCGIPSLENAIQAKGSYSTSWDFSHNSFRAIYTPRWTIDPVWGGSSFLEYKDFFFEIADSHPKLDILVRPHPLMFDHFVKTGLLQKADVDAYQVACDSRPNIRLDTEKEYLATFWNSNVLICDYSSMIIEYFVTQKPIIYLTYDEKIEYTDQMNAMLSASYIVHTEDELRAVIEDLLDGKDPLAGKRTDICNQVLLSGHNSAASENMKQILLDCYRA